MSPGRHVDPLGRSRLKSEIDAQGEIKVVKFPVSINAAELHKSARNGTLLLRFDYRNIDTVRNARPLVDRGQYFPRPASSDIGHLFFSENWCSTRSRSYPFPSFLFFPPVAGKFTLCSAHASRIKILDFWTDRFRIGFFEIFHRILERNYSFSRGGIRGQKMNICIYSWEYDYIFFYY